MEKSKRFSFKWFFVSALIILVVIASYSYGAKIINYHSVANKCFVEQPESESSCYDHLCFGKDGSLSLTSYFQNGDLKDELPSNACSYVITKDKMLIVVTGASISKEYTIKWINNNSFKLIDNDNIEATLALKGSVDDKTRID